MALRPATRLWLVAIASVLAIAALEWGLRRESRLTAKALPPDSQATERVRTLVASSVRARTVVLCDRPGSVPEADGEWQMLADGEWVLRRPPPLAPSPGGMELPAFAVVLPTGRLDGLDARCRASLLDFLSVAWADRPVPADRLRLQGVEASETDKVALLGWLR